MEHISEFFQEGAAVWIFCIAIALLFCCFRQTDEQTNAVKAAIYEQHMLYGTQID